MQGKSVRLVVSLVVAAILLGIVPAAQAQFVMPMHLIPVIARLHGAQGTFWKSDLSISNVGTVDATVQAAFFREKKANQFPLSFPVSVTVPAGDTVTVEDVLGTWFPNEGDTKGALLILSPTTGAALAVASRTYNAADPKGTYGQAVPSAFLNMIFGVGQAIVPGIRNDDNYRSSIGILNIGPKAAKAHITFFDASGKAVAEQTKTIQSFSLEQWNVSKLGLPKLDKPGRAVVTLDVSTSGYDPCDVGTFLMSSVLLVYGSTVDNRTGDAVFSMGQVQWDEYAQTCGSTPNDDCNPTGQSMRFIR